MQSRPAFTIRISARRLLLAGGAGLALLALIFTSATGAQDEAPGDINSVTAEPDQVAPPPAVAAQEEAPDGFVYTINGELVAVDSLGSAAPAHTEQLAAAGGGAYYLTDANFQTDEVLTACAAGYHMASLWEIIDPSNLTYAANHPDAHTKSDGGTGPPSGWNGWIRTGRDSSVANSAGSGNCALWTSTSSGDYGTTVRLTTSWATPPNEIGGFWDAGAFDCSFTGPVWCVAD